MVPWYRSGTTHHLTAYVFFTCACMWCVEGRTALHWAAAMDNEEAARVLICHHANVDAQDEHNQTALFLAAYEGSFRVAQILLQLGKANTDLPDHMERFPRDVAMEYHHHDISQLIEQFSQGPATGLSTISSPTAGIPSVVGAQASKARSKKSSGSSHRKHPARSSGPDAFHAYDERLQHPVELDPARQRPKKKKTQRVSLPPSQMQSAARLIDILDPSEPRLFTAEQPPSYENAINGQRAQMAAMQRAASGVGMDAQPVYHTGMPFEEPPPLHQFEASPGMACAGMMVTEALRFHPPPAGVVLRPSAYLAGGLVEAELSSQMVHNSPTVPSCQAYSPPGMAAVHGPEVTALRVGHQGPQLQLLQQRGQLHPSQNPHHHHHGQHLPTPSMTSDVSNTACVSVPGSTMYAQPTPSSAVSGPVFQYPTPPSHRSASDTTSPPLMPPAATNHPNYPTPPSLETSPGHCSNSSPQSDWSLEHTQHWSPHRAVISANDQNIKSEPAYI